MPAWAPQETHARTGPGTHKDTRREVQAAYQGTNKPAG